MRDMYIVVLLNLYGATTQSPLKMDFPFELHLM